MRLFPERTISLVEMRLYCPYGYVKAAGYLYILHAVTFTHEQYLTADLRKRVDCFPQFCLPLTSLGPVVDIFRMDVRIINLCLNALMACHVNTFIPYDLIQVMLLGNDFFPVLYLFRKLEKTIHDNIFRCVNISNIVHGEHTQGIIVVLEKVFYFI